MRSTDLNDESFRPFDGLFEAVPDAMVATDVDGVIVRANERARRLFSCRRHDLLGAPMESFLPDRFRDQYREHRAAFIAGNVVTAPELEIYGLDCTGLEIPIDVTVGRLDVSGTAYVLMVMREVSDRLATEERLNALSRAKDEFVATVSHELRTPLTAILGFADILGSEDLDAATREELLRGISEQSAEAAGIIEDLLVAARADIGEVAVSSEEVDLAKEVQTVLSALTTDQAGRIAFQSGEAPARADPSRVRQIMRNLITNAFRYGGPDIRIRITSAHDEVTAQVEDNGAGVSQEEAELIFEPYHHTQDAASASVGLGLTVSRQLARLMGGDLTYARSDGWSVFSLSLPRAGVLAQPRRA